MNTQPETVLIVDDEDDIREVAALTLETLAGYNVATSASGRDALARIPTLRPDLILLDMMMPGMDGLTTYEELRKMPEHAAIPVIFLTAKLQPADRRRFEETGAIGVIAKPFDPLLLPAEIRELLSRSAH